MIRFKRRNFLIIVLVLILFLCKPSLLNSLKETIFEIINLPLKAYSKIKHVLKSQTFYVRENFMLKEKSASMALEEEKLSDVINENKRLREILEFKEQKAIKSIGAEVIGRVPQSWNNILVIDKGSSKNIKKKMAVCSDKGLIGTVIEVYKHTSKVMLITDRASKIGVVLQDTRQTGIMEGDGYRNCKVIYLSIDSVIKIGEKVFTSGLGGIYPEGILIGTVKKVENDPIGLFIFAIVEPQQDLNELEFVICIE